MEGKKTFFKYSEQDLRDALRAIREDKTKIREAGRRYNVPHSTLVNKLKNNVPEERRMGPPTILTKEEEELLTNWIKASAKKGIPINKENLLSSVADIIADDKRKTPFTKNKPGQKWFQLFLNRHKDITLRHTESINLARASITESKIREWHKNLEDFLTNENVTDILTDPSRIFNADESGFLTNPKTGLVLGPRGEKDMYDVKTGNEKESITALVTLDAAGEIYPPMVVYPYTRAIPKEIVLNMPEKWIGGKSESGWMTSPTFYSYMVNDFFPEIKRRNIKLPVLFLVDGHRSHLNYNTSKFCADNGILLYALLPNCTHILQPADVSVFRSLKSNWKKSVERFKQTSHMKNVTKSNFAPLLKQAIDGVSAETVQNGFRKCGIYPFNVENIDFKKCLTHPSRTTIVKPTTSFGVEHVLYIESLMKSGRAEEFRSAYSKDKWNGDESASELFFVWKKLRERFIENNNESPAQNSESITADIERQATVGIHVEEIERQATVGIHVEQIEKQAASETVDNSEIEIRRVQEVPLQVDTHLVMEYHQARDNQRNPVVECQDIENQKSPKAHKKSCKISPSFAKRLVWPTESPRKSKLKRRRLSLPDSATAPEWLDYWKGQENLKKEAANKKKEKQVLREKKKLEKANQQERKKKRTKSTSDESDPDDVWNNSGDSNELSDEHVDEDNEDCNEDCNEERDVQLKEGDFIQVDFPGRMLGKMHRYTCAVQTIENEDIEVMGFTQLEPRTNRMFVANEKDISTINKSQIIRKLKQPVISAVGNRIRYIFSDNVSWFL